MQRFSLLGGAAIIAAAILYVFRWEVAAASPEKTIILDRWTGHAVQCTRLFNTNTMTHENVCDPVNGGR